MGAAPSLVTDLRDAWDYMGSDVSPAMVLLKNKFAAGDFVMIDVDEIGRKEAPDEDDKLKRMFYAPSVNLRFGRIRGHTAAASSDPDNAKLHGAGGKRNIQEYTVQVENEQIEVLLKRFILPLHLPELSELKERNIKLDCKNRFVAVEIEWQGGKKFKGELLGRSCAGEKEDGSFEVHFEVRFTGGEKEVLGGVPVAFLHPVEDVHEDDLEKSPNSFDPDPLWMLDRKIQCDIDAKWNITRRTSEALSIIKYQMRPPTAEALRGPFVGQHAFDSEGYPAHPYPIPELKIDGAFVDTWGKYAGKVKFATTCKIGPSYPRMDAWVDRVDAGDPLYFHVALPVYAGMICLGMYKNPGESGPGEPEWIRPSDVALVGVALYVDKEHVPGKFTKPQAEKNGLKKYGHECCHFIPGCTSTYFADSSWIGGVFCLAPQESDFELLDDIYTITEYHQMLEHQYNANKNPSFGAREIEVQVNLVLSTNYLANIRQVCAGSVKVALSDQGVAMSYERMKHIAAKRLNTDAAQNPKRGRKTLSEVTYEEAVDQALIEYPNLPGNMAGPPALMPKGPSLEPEKDMKNALEKQFGKVKRARVQKVEEYTPLPPGTVHEPAPPALPSKGYAPSGPSAGSKENKIGLGLGLMALPPPPPPAKASASPSGYGAFAKKEPKPPKRQANAQPSPPKVGFPPPPPRPPNFAH